MGTRYVRTALAALLVCMLLGGGVALANGVYDIPWSVISGGGGWVSGGGLILDYSTGLPVAGPIISAGDYQLCLGYWCGLPSWRWILSIPLIESGHVP